MLEISSESPYPAAIDFVDVRDRLEIEDNAANNALLQDLVTEAQSDLEGWIGRALARQGYVQVLAGRARHQLSLASFPIDPDLVTVKIDGTAVTDWYVESEEEGLLFRSARWPGTEKYSSDGVTPKIEVTYTAGWVTPEAIAAYDTTGKLAGQWTRETLGTNPFLFEVTTAGAPTAEPTWPTTAGDSVVDGAVTWTARRAFELPRQLRTLMFKGVARLWDREPSNLQKAEAEGMKETYEGSYGVVFSKDEILEIQGFMR